MNAALTSFLRTLNAYYDKIVALGMLLVLLVSLLILLVRVGTDQAEHERFTSSLQALAPLNPEPAPPELALFRDALEGLREPYRIASWDRRLATPERRVHCVNCERPIGYDLTACPYCAWTQPGDPVPDVLSEWEQEYGLDLRDPYVAGRDLDGDGFSNLEEFLFGTDPTDPADFPPPETRLRLEAIRSQPFNMLFMGRSRLGEKEIFQVNLRTGGRTYWAEMGDELEGYLLAAYEERFEEQRGRPVDVSVLTLERGDLRIDLVKGRVTPHVRHHARLIFEIDASIHNVAAGDVFEIMGQRFEALEIDPAEKLVNLRKPADDTTVRIGTTTISERKRAAGRFN